MLERLAADKTFGVSFEDLQSALQPARFVGRSPEQVDEFLETVINPLLASHSHDSAAVEEIRV
jgi:adenylosuccinate lyase